MDRDKLATPTFTPSWCTGSYSTDSTYEGGDPEAGTPLWNFDERVPGHEGAAGGMSAMCQHHCVVLLDEKLLQ